MFWKNRQFKEIQAEWYEILKQSGFNDIEVSESRLTHKETSQFPFRHMSKKVIEQRQDYFILIEQKFNEHVHEFDDGIDYFVMYKICKGYKVTEIIRILKNLGYPIHKSTVMFIKRRYENKWGIRKWNPDQLKPTQKKA